MEIAPTRPTTRLRILAVPLGAALIALLLGSLTPAVGALLVALALGIVVANALPLSPAFLTDQASATKLMLRLGVVLLGLRLPFQDIVAMGLKGAVIVAVTVSATYYLTRRLGARLGVEPGLTTLLAAGFSICGAAAIAAISDVVRAKQRDVALAVAMVTIFGGLMIGFVPWAAGMLDMRRSDAALWAGASIHEVAQVVAAASLLGGNAVAVAMLIKLGRVATLAPITAIAGRGHGQTSGFALPWFLIGFAVAALVRTVVPLPTPVLDGASTLTTLLLGAGMFGLGLGLRFRDLWPLPRAVLLLACGSTLIALTTSLTLILLLPGS